MAIQALLGENLIKFGGKTVPTSDLEGDGKIIGLYFSAHWCPPCRMFTPQLVEFYKKMKQSDKGGKFEIVFVSSDSDQSSFDEYFESMPWLALPFTDRGRKTTLNQKYKVQGIPTFILLSGSDGKVVTRDGRSAVNDDPEGAEFPWTPKPFSELIAGPLVKNDGTEVQAGDALKDVVKGIYFSAHWCPPCQAFTPKLVQVYNKLRQLGKSFEVVFVSSDRDQIGFSQYFKQMPWLAIPFEDTGRKSALSRMFELEGIPYLVLLDEKDQLITKNGQPTVASDPEAAEFPWNPKPLCELTAAQASSLNDSPSLIYFTDGSADQKSKALELFTETAEQHFAKPADDEKKLLFFYGASDEICDNVREFAGIDEWPLPLLVILDITNQVLATHPKYAEKKGAELTAADVKEFVGQWEAGALATQPLGM